MFFFINYNYFSKTHYIYSDLERRNVFSWRFNWYDISIYIFTKQNNLSFFYFIRFSIYSSAYRIILGRISNFINTELYGRVTDFPFAIIYPLIDNNPRHPSQLYEAFFEGVVLFIILYLIFIKKYSAGIISAYFLILYSIFRFLIEFLREPDLHLGLYLNYFSMGQILCIPIFFAGILILFRR